MRYSFALKFYYSDQEPCLRDCVWGETCPRGCRARPDECPIRFTHFCQKRLWRQRPGGGLVSEFRGRSVLTQSARVWVIHELEPVAMGIKWMLEQEADIQVIGTAKTPGFLPPGQVDVIVWGWEKTVGPGVLRNFPLPQTAVIALTGSADADVLREMGRGVSGFVTKRDMEEMPLAVRTVHRGGCYFSPSFQEVLLETVSPSVAIPHASLQKTLTKMEIRVIQELVKDKTNQEITEALHISKRTVEYHIASIIQKWGVNSRVGLAVMAVNPLLEKISRFSTCSLRDRSS